MSLTIKSPIKQYQNSINHKNINRIVASHTQRSYHSNSSNHRYRDCSIYDKNLTLQIQKENMFKNRELELRKKYENMDPEKLKALLPLIQSQVNRTKYTFEELYTNPLSPQALNKQTYLEIFNSRKESLKKPLNFINYSNMSYDVVSNSIMGNAYEVYLNKKIDYDCQVPQFKEQQNQQSQQQPSGAIMITRPIDREKQNQIIVNRKIQNLQMKSHIISNIHKIRQLQSKNIVDSTVSQSSKFEDIKANSNKKLLNQSFVTVSTGQTKPFDIRDLYKIMEVNRSKNSSNIQIGNSGIITQNKQRANSVAFSQQRPTFLKKTPLDISTGIYDDKTKRVSEGTFIDHKLKDLQNEMDDMVSVIGQKKQIKENAYSDAYAKEDYSSQNKFVKLRDKLRSQASSQRRHLPIDLLSKHKLTNQNLQSLSRHGDIDEQRSVKVSKSISEFKANNNENQEQDSASIISKRWQNLEKYIEQKKKNKDKNDAYSHASEFIDKSSRKSYSVRGIMFDGRTKGAVNEQLSLDQNSIEHRDDLDSDIEEEDSIDGSLADHNVEQQNERGIKNESVDLKLKSLKDELFKEKQKREKLEDFVYQLKSDLSHQKQH